MYVNIICTIKNNRETNMRRTLQLQFYLVSGRRNLLYFQEPPEVVFYLHHFKHRSLS
jgi:hypothetical protein